MLVLFCVYACRLPELYGMFIVNLGNLLIIHGITLWHKKIIKISLACIPKWFAIPNVSGSVPKDKNASNFIFRLSNHRG